MEKVHKEKVRAHLLSVASHTAVGASMLYSEPVSNKKHNTHTHTHIQGTEDDLHKNNMLFICIYEGIHRYKLFHFNIMLRN